MSKIYIIECVGEYNGTLGLFGVYSTRKQAKEAYDKVNPYCYAYLYEVPLNQEIKDGETYLIRDPDDNWVNEEP
jgi:hypothetical protein